jgi:hypothetical protein
MIKLTIRRGYAGDRVYVKPPSGINVMKLVNTTFKNTIGVYTCQLQIVTTAGDVYREGFARITHAERLGNGPHFRYFLCFEADGAAEGPVGEYRLSHAVGPREFPVPVAQGAGFSGPNQMQQGLAEHAAQQERGGGRRLLGASFRPVALGQAAVAVVAVAPVARAVLSSVGCLPPPCQCARCRGTNGGAAGDASPPPCPRR